MNAHGWFCSVELRKGDSGFGMKISSFPKGPGVSVSSLIRGGPAERAGLLPGDIIISIGGVCMVDEVYENVLERLRESNVCRITVLREREQQSVGGGEPASDVVTSEVTLSPSSSGLGLRISVGHSHKRNIYILAILFVSVCLYIMVYTHTCMCTFDAIIVFSFLFSHPCKQVEEESTSTYPLYAHLNLLCYFPSRNLTQEWAFG